jgi:hypothetical protein
MLLLLDEVTLFYHTLSNSAFDKSDSGLINKWAKNVGTTSSTGSRASGSSRSVTLVPVNLFSEPKGRKSRLPKLPDTGMEETYTELCNFTDEEVLSRGGKYKVHGAVRRAVTIRSHRHYKQSDAEFSRGPLRQRNRSPS